MKGREAMKKAAAVLLAIFLLCSVACADYFSPITTDYFIDLYETVREMYAAPQLGELITDPSLPTAQYWEMEHERIILILDNDENVKGAVVTADLSSRLFLNVCFSVLQAVHNRAFTKEDKGLIIERYFMTNRMPEGYWSLNDQVMYQFVFSESENVMNVFVD